MWRLTIEGQRYKVADHIADNPSLNAMLDEAITTGYRYARLDAERWAFGRIMNEAFRPEG